MIALNRCLWIVSVQVLLQQKWFTIPKKKYLANSAPPSLNKSMDWDSVHWMDNEAKSHNKQRHLQFFRLPYYPASRCMHLCTKQHIFWVIRWFRMVSRQFPTRQFPTTTVFHRQCSTWIFPPRHYPTRQFPKRQFPIWRFPKQHDPTQTVSHSSISHSTGRHFSTKVQSHSESIPLDNFPLDSFPLRHDPTRKVSL